GLICLPLRLPPLVIAATLLQLATLFLTVSMVGNFVSIIMPQHISPGTLRPTKLRIEIVLLMLVLQLVMMAIMTPIFLPAFLGWLWGRMELPWFIPVNLIVSAALCAGTTLIYWLTLEPLGRLLHQRETKILASVTAEVE
ncbi:MAG: hypothetical protein ACRED1_13345, partial [Limisphaerales bacterium]